MIPEPVRVLASADNFAVLSTILSDGSVQSHVMWVGCDDDAVLINTELHRMKFRNITKNPRVTVTILDKENPYRYVEIRGKVGDIVRGQPARDHIDELSRKYTGGDYPDAAIQSERVILRIFTDTVFTRGF